MEAYRADVAFDGERVLAGGARVLVRDGVITGVEPCTCRMLRPRWSEALSSRASILVSSAVVGAEKLIRASGLAIRLA
jgi:hypothetical protein